MIILGIETSCDETAAAIVKTVRGKVSIDSNIVSSQIKIHAQYGGVVPEVAARQHVQNIIPVVENALAVAKCQPKQIDIIAVTAGPGLMTSLMVGVETARALSFAWDKPLLPVNHMYGHIAGAMAGKKIVFPALCLIVSGGHTEIVLMRSHTKYRKVGATVDDAVGEAYDKVAKLLGLGYPGGPIVSKRALSGNPTAYDLPRPMMSSSDLNFSYSGLKTAVLYLSKKVNLGNEQVVNDLCASFQRAALDVLLAKVKSAAKKYRVKTLMLAGGVAANKQLREDLAGVADELSMPLLVPDFSLCTDNAAMIALGAYYMSQDKKVTGDAWKKVRANPGWEL